MNSRNINTSLTPIARFAMLFAGLLVAGLCQATPVFNVPDAYGMRGEQVEVSLIDEAITDLDSATLKAIYDPLYLEFSNATAGELTAASFAALPGAPYAEGSLMAVDVSLAGPTTLSGGSKSILALIFNILPSAPLGVTPVSFEAIDTDYDVSKTTGDVHVIAQDVAVPEPGTMALMLAGLLLMLYRAYGAEEKRSGAKNSLRLVRIIRGRHY